MKRKQFTEKQIIGILKEHEAGSAVADLSRRHGVSEQSIYRWKAKFGGMDVSDAKRLKELEHENGRLKRLLADAMLENGNARRPKGCCTPPHGCARPYGASGVPGGRPVAHGGALYLVPLSRRRAAVASEGIG
jgi:putative transposase